MVGGKSFAGGMTGMRKGRCGHWVSVPASSRVPFLVPSVPSSPALLSGAQWLLRHVRPQHLLLLEQNPPQAHQSHNLKQKGVFLIINYVNVALFLTGHRHLSLTVQNEHPSGIVPWWGGQGMGPVLAAALLCACSGCPSGLEEGVGLFVFQPGFYLQAGGAV